MLAESVDHNTGKNEKKKTRVEQSRRVIRLGLFVYN